MKRIYFLLVWILSLGVAAAQGDTKPNEPAAPKEQKTYYFVMFAEGSGNISPEQWTALENFIWDVKLSNPKISKIELHGYSGTSKSEKKYKALASDRADLVKETLMGFGIPSGNIIVTAGPSLAKDLDPSLKRRVTVCIHHTGAIKRNQGQKNDPALDPNFDKKIISTPVEPVPPAPLFQSPPAKTPAKTAPKPAPKKKSTNDSNWDF